MATMSIDSRDFTPACNAHDACSYNRVYTDVSANAYNCNARLEVDMRAACDKGLSRSISGALAGTLSAYTASCYQKAGDIAASMALGAHLPGLDVYNTARQYERLYLARAANFVENDRQRAVLLKVWGDI